MLTDLVSKTGPVQFTKNLENASSYEKLLSRETFIIISALQLGKKPFIVIWVRSVPIKDFNQETVWALRGNPSKILRLYLNLLISHLSGWKRVATQIALESYTQKKLHLHLPFILSKIFARALPKIDFFNRNKVGPNEVTLDPV